MTDESDDVWFFGSLILAHVSEYWLVSLLFLFVAGWIAVIPMVNRWRDK